MIRRVDGELNVGGPVTIHIAFPDRVEPIPVEVSRMNSENEFGWRFSARARWLYCGEHVFTLRSIGRQDPAGGP